MNILVSFTSFKGKWSWMSFFFFVTVPPAAGMKLWRVSSFFYSGEILFFTPGSVLSPGGCTNTLSPGKHEYLILFCFVERCVCWVKSLIVFSPFPSTVPSLCTPLCCTFLWNTLSGYESQICIWTPLCAALCTFFFWLLCCSLFG